jgi:hypothetical protein
VTAPIIGTTKIPHLKELHAAVEITLTAEGIAAVEAPYQPHPIIGYEQPGAKKMLNQMDSRVPDCGSKHRRCDQSQLHQVVSPGCTM